MTALIQMALQRNRIVAGIEWTCQWRKICNADRFQILAGMQPSFIRDILIFKHKKLLGIDRR